MVALDEPNIEPADLDSYSMDQANALYRLGHHIAENIHSLHELHRFIHADAEIREVVAPLRLLDFGLIHDGISTDRVAPLHELKVFVMFREPVDPCGLVIPSLDFMVEDKLIEVPPKCPGGIRLASIAAGLWGN